MIAGIIIFILSFLLARERWFRNHYQEQNEIMWDNLRHYVEYLETDFPIVADLFNEIWLQRNERVYFSGEVFLDKMLEKHVDAKEL